MKTLDLAYKDLLRALRGVSFWAFGLAVPLLVSTIFYFAFGGLAGGDGGLDVAATRVQLVNLDRPAEQAGGFHLGAGQMLADFVKSDELESLLDVTEAADAAAARAAVDRQEAGVAVIIPDGFSAAVTIPGRQAAVEVYQDPTLTLGPAIVRGVVSQFVDALAGSKIAAEQAAGELSERGVAVDPALAQTLAVAYGHWAETLGEEQGAALLQVRTPGSAAEAPDAVGSVISMIMSGMMVFYVFFTGAAMAQTILQEEEAGTLPRLFTTPTPQSAILGGKLLSTLVILVVQVVVLLVVSALVFGVDWGRPEGAALAALALVVLAGSFGLFITSLLKNTRQSGIVYGGVLTMMGMIGMIGIFTAQVPGAGGASFSTVALLTPQGWAVRAWQLLLDGGTLADVLGTLAVMLVLATAFFGLGLLRFRRRYA